MSPADILARMDEQRAIWVELGDGRRVKMHRPLETEMPRLVRGVSVQDVCDCACGWTGFTEATLLGPAVGAADEVPFDAGLWERYVRDDAEAARACIDALVAGVTAYLEGKAATAKN